MNGTFQGFKKFVAQQDPNRKINHGSWCECSVGDYARSVGDHIHHFNDVRYARELLPSALNADLSDKYLANENAPTYGKLHKYLETVEV